MNLTSVVSNVYNKQTKIGIFIANFLLILPYIIINHTVIGLITAAVLLVLLFLILYKSDNNMPAIVYIPLAVLADISIYIGLHFDALRSSFYPKYFQNLFKGLNGTHIALWVYVAGILLLVYGFFSKKSRNAWLTGGGCTLILEAAVLKLKSNGVITMLSFEGYGASLFTWILALGIVWVVFSQFAAITVPQKRVYFKLVEILILSAFLILMSAEMRYFNGVESAWATALLELPHTLFAWWKVILVTVVMVIGAYIKVDDSGFGFRVDSYALIIGAEMILSIKLMMSNYFPFCWILLVGLIIGTFKCMINDYSDHKTTLQLDSASYIVTQYVVFVISLFMLKNGLWINFLISIMWGIVFYHEFFIKKRSPGNQAYWTILLFCIFSEAVAWMWQFRFSISGLVMLMLIFLGVFFTLLIINIKHPASVIAPNSIRAILCGCMVVLCLLSMSKFGTKIKIKTNQIDTNQTVTLVLAARGKTNNVGETYYFWRDEYGKKTSEPVIVRGNSSEICIKDEILTVVTTDAKGIQTTRYYWYPHWLLKE